MPPKKGAHDLTTHSLLEVREVPESIIALRRELQKPENTSLAEKAMKGSTFEECLGILGLELNIALDGLYEAGELCDVLVSAMRNKNSLHPHLQDARLVNAEIVETEGEVEIVEVPTTSLGHTDLMVSPEEIDKFLATEMETDNMAFPEGEYIPPKPFSQKPTIALDFDGVIHDYKMGWQGGKLYGEVTEGFFEWALEAQKEFELVIHSSRASSPEMQEKMHRWINLKFTDWLLTQALAIDTPLHYSVSHGKPPAWVTIDDRALTFRGDWSDPRFSVEMLKAFKPWMTFSP